MEDLIYACHCEISHSFCSNPSQFRRVCCPGEQMGCSLLKKWTERIIQAGMPEEEAGGWTTACVWVGVDHSLHGTCFTEGQGILVGTPKQVLSQEQEPQGPTDSTLPHKHPCGDTLPGPWMSGFSL